MDPTKKPLGAITMAYKDHFFLQRWYDYYAAQIGAENLFIVSHGGDPAHRKIAPSANIITLPRDDTMHRFDRRRWQMLGHLASGFINYYNWMITSDVDEIVLVDPDVAPDLIAYLRTAFPDIATAPKNVAPFCLDIVHLPDLEPGPLQAGIPLLAQRRHYKPDKVYSKPCLVRDVVRYTNGAHLNNLGPRHLPEGLFQLHLRFCDKFMLEGRATEKADATQNAKGPQKGLWSDTRALYQKVLDEKVMMGEEIAQIALRERMLKQYQKNPDFYEWGPIGHAETKKIYRIPDRFSQVF